MHVGYARLSAKHCPNQQMIKNKTAHLFYHVSAISVPMEMWIRASDHSIYFLTLISAAFSPICHTVIWKCTTEGLINNYFEKHTSCCRWKLRAAFLSCCCASKCKENKSFSLILFSILRPICYLYIKQQHSDVYIRMLGPVEWSLWQHLPPPAGAQLHIIVVCVVGS